MRQIYHVLSPTDWDPNKLEPYRAASLAREGFIHCSNRDQVARVANLLYADQTDLAVLRIDADALGSPVRDEDPGTGELFPHVYGPIPRDAVLEVRPLCRGSDNQWVFQA